MVKIARSVNKVQIAEKSCGAISQFFVGLTDRFAPYSTVSLVMTSSDLAQYSVTQSIMWFLCNSWASCKINWKLETWSILCSDKFVYMCFLLAGLVYCSAVIVQVSCRWLMLAKTQMALSSSCALPKLNGMLLELPSFLFLPRHLLCYILAFAVM